MEGEIKVWGINRELWRHNCCEAHILNLSPSNGNPVCCSTHSHAVKQNLFYVFSGRVFIIADGHVSNLTAGQSITIKPGQVHQFLTDQESIVLEIVWAESIIEDINRVTSGKEMTKEEFEAAVLHAVAK
mgnify:FL=1